MVKKDLFLFLQTAYIDFRPQFIYRGFAQQFDLFRYYLLYTRLNITRIKHVKRRLIRTRRSILRKYYKFLVRKIYLFSKKWFLKRKRYPAYYKYHSIRAQYSLFKINYIKYYNLSLLKQKVIFQPLFAKFFITSRAIFAYTKKWYLKNYNHYKKQQFQFMGSNLRCPTLVQTFIYKLTNPRNKRSKRPNTQIYTFNLKTRFLKILQQARELHWIYSDKKTCREHSYKIFLKKEIRYSQKNMQNNNFLFNYLFLNFIIDSYKDWLFLLKNQAILLNNVIPSFNAKINKGDIVQLITGFKFFKYQKIIQKNKFSKIRKSKRWYSLQYIYKAKPWLKQKKKLPKITKRLQPLKNMFNNIIQYDFITGTFCFFKMPNIPNLNYDWNLRYTQVLKLYNWRYRAE